MFALIRQLFGKKDKTPDSIIKTHTDEFPSESINVEKIISVENDLDFLKNKLFFDFKKDEKISSVELYKLLNHYKKVSDREANEVENKRTLALDKKDTQQLIDLVTTSHNEQEILSCLLLLEKRI